MNAPPLRRLYRFAGTLAEINSAPLDGIHQSAIVLIDDKGQRHLVMMVHGRGDAGLAANRALRDSLQIGRRYHGLATKPLRGDAFHHWFGHVEMQPDQRRLIIAPPHATGHGLEVPA